MTILCIYNGCKVRISQGHPDREARGQVGTVTAVQWANHGKMRYVRVGETTIGKWHNKWVHLVMLPNGREVQCTEAYLTKE